MSWRRPSNCSPAAGTHDFEDPAALAKTRAATAGLCLAKVARNVESMAGMAM